MLIGKRPEGGVSSHQSRRNVQPVRLFMLTGTRHLFISCRLIDLFQTFMAIRIRHYQRIASFFDLIFHSSHSIRLIQPDNIDSNHIKLEKDIYKLE